MSAPALLALAIAAALPLWGCAAPDAVPGRPNLIVILTDDQGYADLGAQAVDADVRTPHLDRLAREGIRFTAGYVTSPQCRPSRAGLLTGRHPSRFGRETNREGALPLQERTLAERLGEAGYVTGMFGKWDLAELGREAHGGDSRRSPAHGPGAQGFDEYWSGLLDTHAESGPTAVDAGDDRVEVVFEAARSFIARHADEPFFLYIAPFAPHVPLRATPEALARVAHVEDATRRLGLAMIATVDDDVGRIAADLESRGIAGRTLIFFLSDNGAPIREEVWNGSINTPLVGEKGMLTEGGIRVPFLVHWPGVVAPRVEDAPVSALDVAPTMVSLAGLPDDPALDGVDLVPHLLDASVSPPRESLAWRWRSQSAIRHGSWKLIALGGSHRFLFDLASPDGESVDVRERHPAVADDLERRLRRWAANLEPPGLPTDIRPRDRALYERHLGIALSD